MPELVQYYGTGRRKRAVARVFLRPGSGDFKGNGRAFEQYFVTESQRSSAKQALVSADAAATFNVIANVSGGGVNGQADAVKLGIARALMLFNSELRKKLKSEGLVSRRPRQRTQEVRTEGREKALPVQQAVSGEHRACVILIAHSSKLFFGSR